MRISKRSPRRSEAFRSRFEEAGREAAPIRHARWLRDELAGHLIHSLLQAGFAVALLFFARAVFHLFERHGGDLNPWYLRMSLVAILVCFMLVVRRLILRAREFLEARRQLSEIQQELESMRRAGRRSP